MKTVHIRTSGEYDVMIQRGLLSSLGEETAKLMPPCRAVLVCGEKSGALFAQHAEDSLRRAGFEVLRYVHPSGELSKSLAEYGALQLFLSENHITRSDVLLALGGGVTGDLAGFAAATYQRGMAYIQVPTTLLAAVDSSVGGKTALNLPSAKNQIGCFWQPKAVFCDPDTLSALSEAEYRCGEAEVIKYAVLGDAAFFSALEEQDIRSFEEEVIARCVAMKRDIVEADEFDTGCRRMLNLGHTIGHAIEKCSGFTWTHGDAVAAGLAFVVRGAARYGFCPAEDAARVLRLLEKYALPVACEFPRSQLYDAILSDKKITGGKLHLVVPERIGSCRILPMEPEDILSWL